MSTVQAFNHMLRNFLEELADTFPEEPAVRMYLDGFDSLVKANARKPLEMFVGSIAPYTDLVMKKDPELFSKLQLGSIDLAKLWNDPGVEDATRDAIWQYVHLLFMLGTTVQNLPDQLLTSIESVAQSCASQIQEGSLDFSAMTSMLSNLGSGLGGLGSLDAASAPSLGSNKQLK